MLEGTFKRTGNVCKTLKSHIKGETEWFVCENFMHKIITLFRQLIRFKQTEAHTMLIDYRVKNR